MARNYAFIAAALLLILTGCRTATSEPIEMPVKITACQLMTDPAAYNHRLVEVSGRVSVGFEDFTIMPTDDCGSRNMVWLELGGSADSGTIYCCGDHHRDVPAVVEGIVTPLVKDARTDRFVKIVQSMQTASGPTTLIGRFFAGEQRTLPGGTFWLGYGHMGCCSLLVIQQVLD